MEKGVDPVQLAQVEAAASVAGAGLLLLLLLRGRAVAAVGFVVEVASLNDDVVVLLLE